MNKATNTHCWNQSRHINALPPTHFLLLIVIALIYLAIFMTWLPFLWCYHNEAVFESFLIYFPSKKIEKCCCRGIFHDCVISYCLKWWTNGQRRRKKKCSSTIHVVSNPFFQCYSRGWIHKLTWSEMQRALMANYNKKKRTLPGWLKR